MWHWLCTYKAYKDCNRFRRVTEFLYSSRLYCCKSVFISCFFWDNWTCNASNSSYSKQGFIAQFVSYFITYIIIKKYWNIVNWELMHLVPESCDTFCLNITVFRFRSELWGYKTFWVHLIQQKNILKMTNYSMLTLLGHIVFPRWLPI